VSSQSTCQSCTSDFAPSVLGPLVHCLGFSPSGDVQSGKFPRRACWGGNSSLWGYALGNAIGESCRIAQHTTWVLNPLYKSFVFSEGLDTSITSTIQTLLAARYKPAVVGTISLVVVPAVNLQPRLVAVLDSPVVEGLKILPLYARADATPPVVMETRVPRILATIQHTIPHSTQLLPVREHRPSALVGAVTTTESSYLAMVLNQKDFTAAFADQFDHSRLRVASEILKGKPTSESLVFDGGCKSSSIPRTIVQRDPMEVN